MRTLVLGLTLGFATIVQSSDAVQAPPAGFVEARPDDVKWMPNRGLAGGHVAIVFGDPAKPGPYTLRARMPAGARVMPHTHPEPRTYTVLAGEWKLGFGRTFDAAALRAYPAGSVYRLPEGVPHFQAVDVADTIVQIEGIGPSATNYIDPNHDPRKKQP
jgi:hypothetical protein